ncbi:MAG: hypothetical protein ACP5RS_05665 [Thermoplasmata archaeon]
MEVGSLKAIVVVIVIASMFIGIGMYIVVYYPHATNSSQPYVVSLTTNAPYQIDYGKILVEKVGIQNVNRDVNFNKLSFAIPNIPKDDLFYILFNSTINQYIAEYSIYTGWVYFSSGSAFYLNTTIGIFIEYLMPYSNALTNFSGYTFNITSSSFDVTGNIALM